MSVGDRHAGRPLGAPTPSALLGLKVLLVEDDENMRDIMRWTLEGAGASVVPVSTGSEAIEVIEAGEQAAAHPTSWSATSACPE